MSDLFDPADWRNWRPRDEGDPELFMSDGAAVFEALAEQDSFMDAAGAIANLDAHGIKAALVFGLLTYKRAHGMTVDECREWLLRDLPD